MPNPSARIVGRADGVEQVGWHVRVDVFHGRDDHGVGAGESVQPVVRLHAESADPDRALAADYEVVPGVCQAGGVADEDLAGQGELELQHPVGGGERDSGQSEIVWGVAFQTLSGAGRC